MCVCVDIEELVSRDAMALTGGILLDDEEVGLSHSPMRCGWLTVLVVLFAELLRIDWFMGPGAAARQLQLRLLIHERGLE